MSQNGWDEFALLLIDVQKDFWEDEVQKSFPQFPQNVEKLLNICRGEGLEVIHIRALFSLDRSDWMVPYRLKGSIPCVAGTPGADVLDCARELPGEKVIIKHTFDSFMNSELHEYLQTRGKRFLLTAGLVTSICVFLSTASAVQKGYLVSLVADCSADEAKAHHQTIARYEPIFMPQVGCEQVVLMQHNWQDQLIRLQGPTAAAIGADKNIK